MAGLVLFLSLILSTNLYAGEDCADCENDTLAPTSAANALGNGELNEMMEKLKQVGPRRRPPLGNIKDEEHRKQLCTHWETANWTWFKKVLTKHNYKLKDIYYNLRCNFGYRISVPILHFAGSNVTLHKVMYKRFLLELHKEGANNIASCAIEHVVYKNQRVWDEINYTKDYAELRLQDEKDPEFIRILNGMITNANKMEKKLKAHLEKHPVEAKDCPKW